LANSQLVAHLKKHLVINVGQNLLECLTCIRLLTRLIPVAFEGSSADSFEELLFWKNTIPTGMESQGVAPVDQPGLTSFIYFSREVGLKY
jgi:hypothetical protein